MLSVAAAHAEIVDRIAVTVGKQVITESDVLADLRVSAFIDQRPLNLTGEQKRKSADRLVEQTLILKEAAFSRVPPPAPEEGAKMLEQIKLPFASDSEYRAALTRYGLTENELLQHLTNGLRALRFTDLRFRPEVQVSPDEVREFYEKQATELRRTNPARVPAFEVSREEMEKLLIEERVAQALDRWLGTQRTELEILYREPVFK